MKLWPTVPSSNSAYLYRTRGDGAGRSLLSVACFVDFKYSLQQDLTNSAGSNKSVIEQ